MINAVTQLRANWEQHDKHADLVWIDGNDTLQ